VETGEAGYSARNNTSGSVVWGRDREDGVKMRVRITQVHGSSNDASKSVECWAGGVVFVRGTTDAGLYNASRAPSLFSSYNEYGEDNDAGNGASGEAEIGVLLAGQGSARGKTGVKVREGLVVGIRAPMWDVDVGSGGTAEKWIVGVEWVVLS
jgi:hypothetical protein